MECLLVSCPALLAAVTNLRSLAVGERVTAVVNHTDPNQKIRFLMCGGSSCSRVDVFGLEPSGALRHLTRTDCDKMGLCRILSWEVSVSSYCRSVVVGPGLKKH